MKKIFSLGLMLAALALTCCSKDAVEEQMNPAGAGAFELVADLDGGRTVADGIQTAWAAADAINVWTNVSGEETYTSHGSFAIAEEDLATSTFRGTLAAELTEASYDWYAFYPYSKYNGYSNSSPAKTAYNKIADKDQQQDGNNNQKHIAGANAPLYGVDLGVAAGEKPALQFKHLSTLVKVVVTNATDEPISIKNVRFETETEKISGTFYTNLIEGPSYESSGDSYTYNYVNLAVTGAENIDAFDGKAEFYLNVCPFGAKAAETVTVTVTVTDGGDQVVTKTYTYTIPAGSSLSKPGKITTLNFTFDIPEEVTATTLAEVNATGTGSYALIENVTVLALGSSSGILEDATGRLFVYGKFITDYAVGDVLNLTNATVGQYNNYLQLTAATIEKTGTTTINRGTPTVVAGAEMASYVSSFTSCDYIQLTASEISLGQYQNFYMDGYSKSASFVYPAFNLNQYNGLPAEMIGYACYVNPSSYFYFLPIEVSPLPHLIPEKTAVTFSAEAGTQTIAVTSDNVAWTVSEDADWLTAVNTDGALVVTVDAYSGNTDADREATITLTHATDNTIQATITITQSAAGATTIVDEISVSTWMSSTYLGYGATTGTLPTTPLTYGNFSVVFAKGTGSTQPGYNKEYSFRLYTGNTMTISSSKTIAKIEFTHTSTTYVGNNVTSDVGTYVVSGNTGTWSGESTSVTFTNDPSKNVQMRITYFKVTYK